MLNHNNNGFIMQRKSIDYIKQWFARTTRKPLIIRGARQVGKTTAVELAADQLGVELITLNMEDRHSFVSELVKNDPRSIFELIALSQSKSSLVADKTLFFFDEAQARPEIIPFLRYCYEKTPEYRVILTGSLLEFVIQSPDFSFPVGRVEFLYMGPMGFEEFLRGTDQVPLADKLHELALTNPPSQALHELYSEQLRVFTTVGGMPEAINVYSSTGSWIEVSRVKSAILETYEADFGKYQKRINSDVLQQVFRKLPFAIAKRTIYSRLTEGGRVETNKKALEALELARVITRCYHSAGNGLPLSSEQKSKDFKLFFLDVGLVLTAFGMNIDAISHEPNDTARGTIAEQLIAQHLLADREQFEKPHLYYWNRQKKGTTSEIDFLSTVNGSVVPIEVKSGAAGSMKSLQVFMERKKKSGIAVRFLNNLPESQTIELSGSKGEFTLISLPHYLVEQWRRIVGGV